MTSTISATEFATDRHGFPVVTCPKCAGAGTIAGYSNVFGGTCFRCKGARRTYPTPAVRRLAEEFAAARRSAGTVTMSTTVHIAADDTRTVIDGVNPGDIIRPHNDAAWRTVATVRRTRRVGGEGYSGGRLVHLRLQIQVTFTDGSATTGHGFEWERAADVTRLTELRNTLVAQATAAYRRTLADRDRREARRSTHHTATPTTTPKETVTEPQTTSPTPQDRAIALGGRTWSKPGDPTDVRVYLNQDVWARLINTRPHPPTAPTNH